MKNFITLGILWYDVVQTTPKTLEYFLYHRDETGSITNEGEMDKFVDKYHDCPVVKFEIDFKRSLLYVQIDKPCKQTMSEYRDRENVYEMNIER